MRIINSLYIFLRGETLEDMGEWRNFESVLLDTLHLEIFLVCNLDNASWQVTCFINSSVASLTCARVYYIQCGR